MNLFLRKPMMKPKMLVTRTAGNLLTLGKVSASCGILVLDKDSGAESVREFLFRNKWSSFLVFFKTKLAICMA